MFPFFLSRNEKVGEGLEGKGGTYHEKGWVNVPRERRGKEAKW